MGTSRHPRHMGATSKVGTMGARRRTLRLQVNTQAREGTAPRTAGCHTTTAAILRTRRAGCCVIDKEAIGLLDDASWEAFRLAVRSIESGLKRGSFPMAIILCSRQGGGIEAMAERHQVGEKRRYHRPDRLYHERGAHAGEAAVGQSSGGRAALKGVFSYGGIIIQLATYMFLQEREEDDREKKRKLSTSGKGRARNAQAFYRVFFCSPSCC